MVHTVYTEQNNAQRGNILKDTAQLPGIWFKMPGDCEVGLHDNEISYLYIYAKYGDIDTINDNYRKHFICNILSAVT